MTDEDYKTPDYNKPHIDRSERLLKEARRLQTELQTAIEELAEAVANADDTVADIKNERRDRLPKD